MDEGIKRHHDRTVGQLTDFIAGGTSWSNSYQNNRAPREVTARLSTDRELIHVWIGSEVHITLSVQDWRTLTTVVLDQVCLVDDVLVP